MENKTKEITFNEKRFSSPIIWCVASGKGGVGKSFVASSLAICLSKLSYSVTLVDLDFGGPNSHTCLGSSFGKLNWKHFLQNEEIKVSDLVMPLDIPRAYIIPGMKNSWENIKLSPNDVFKMTKAFRQLNTDFVILDLGAGISEENLDFFKFSDEKILVVIPEPASIENVYRYLEAYIGKLLYDICDIDQYNEVMKIITNNREVHKKPFMLRNLTSTLDEMLSLKVMQNIESAKINLIMNQVRSHNDYNLGLSVKEVIQKYFSLRINYLGGIDFDNSVWHSLRKRRPPILDNPFSRLIGQILTITRKLANFCQRKYKAVV